LFDSLESEHVEAAGSTWDEEIRLRVEEFRSGKEKGISWPEARQLILEERDDDAP
jgi:hypothetical protein